MDSGVALGLGVAVVVAVDVGIVVAEGVDVGVVVATSSVAGSKVPSDPNTRTSARYPSDAVPVVFRN
jgi:hypothetical protein